MGQRREVQVAPQVLLTNVDYPFPKRRAKSYDAQSPLAPINDTFDQVQVSYLRTIRYQPGVVHR